MWYFRDMMDSPVDEIKNRLDIVDVVGSYIKLKKAGKDYKALCPFHNEKTPSFFVSSSKQIWHCFGCGAGGDMFSFVMQIEGVEFADALRTLARKAGVILKKQDPELHSQRSKLYEISQEAAEFFEENLKKNKPVLDYLKKRGISLESIKEFRIGYAPKSWDLLYNHLIALGYKINDISKTGLIIKRETNNESRDRGYYDRFRERIMFPICDIGGQVIAFTGRIFSQNKSANGEKEIAKYVNSPESLVFNKSRILYALDKAKVDIRKKDQAILVEGQFDVIMSHQANVKNTIATSGTSLTPDHLKIIKRYTDNLLLAFDEDKAGNEATKKGISLAQRTEFNVKVIILSKGKDPADIIKEKPVIWEKAVKNAKPIMEFHFENVFSKYDLKKLDDKRQIAKELLPPIKRIANEIERAHWLQILASKINIQEKLLNEALAKVKIPDEPGLAKAMQGKGLPTLKKSHIQGLEENLLGLVLKYPEYLDYLKKNLNSDYFTTRIIQEIFQELIKQKPIKLAQDPSADKTGPSISEAGQPAPGWKINLKEFQKKVLPNKPHYLNQAIFQIEHYDLEGKDIAKEIKFYIKAIKSNYFKKKLSELSLAIKKAEEEKDKKGIKKLTKEFDNLSKELAVLTPK